MSSGDEAVGSSNKALCHFPAREVLVKLAEEPELSL